MEQQDRQALIDLKNSYWWQVLIKEYIDQRIEDLDQFLLSPNLEDIMPNDIQKQLNIINQKKLERAYLVWLKNKPDELINSFVI